MVNKTQGTFFFFGTWNCRKHFFLTKIQYILNHFEEGKKR